MFLSASSTLFVYKICIFFYYIQIAKILSFSEVTIRTGTFIAANENLVTVSYKYLSHIFIYFVVFHKFFFTNENKKGQVIARNLP